MISLKIVGQLIKPKKLENRSKKCDSLTTDPQAFENDEVEKETVQALVCVFAGIN